MMVNVSIPTAAMITCDGDQFPVGIRLEALSSKYQPGIANNNNITQRWVQVAYEFYLFFWKCP